MSKYLVRYRYLMLGLTLALAAICGVLVFRVNVNTDLTKYLPDDSRMKAGLELLTSEFDLRPDMAGGDVRVMADSLSSEEKVDLKYQLHTLPEVGNVRVQENGIHTLYELSVDKSIDQVALGREIRESHPKIATVETAQDGTTADPSMLMGGVALLLIVLFAMCASWLEPVLFLASTGIAVLLNIGTNALLPSVSVTTNSLVGILQLVLSMDYSIVLINRFRQERQQHDNSQVAMHRAIQRASGTIVSSALTTIVGLMMLVFMKLKIGADLGIVLSKGVLCSLICTFTVLPTLILQFEKGIERSHKKTPRFHTDRLARFSQKFRIPLTLLFLALLVGSYILHNQTPISFQYTQASQINPFFPKKNPLVLIYDNADETHVSTLMDSLTACQGVETALSYPSLMQKEYRASEMVTTIQGMSQMMAGTDSLMSGAKMDVLSEDVLRLIYYAAHGQKVQRLGFNELANFILEQASNPQSVIASQMSPDMRQKMAILKDFRQLNNMAEEERTIDSTEMDVAAMAEGLDIMPEEITDVTGVSDHQETVTTNSHDESHENGIQETTEIAKPQIYSPYTDTALLQKTMSSNDMASYLKMDPGQAKMVYRLAKKHNEGMTPLEFVHFLTQDILKRKALASMIEPRQKEQLIALEATMDEAMSKHQSLPTEGLTSTHSGIAASHENDPTDLPAKLSIDNPALEGTDCNDSVLSFSPETSTIASGGDVLADSTEDPLTLLDEMMNGTKRYTAAEMAENFNAMGEPVGRELMELLYLYYGGSKKYNECWTLSLGGMVTFLSDSVINDPRFANFVTPDMKNGFNKIRIALDEGVGMLRSNNHSIAIVVTGLPEESDETYAFLDNYKRLCDQSLPHGYYSVGESVMLAEMKAGFQREMTLVTLLTIAAIFLIVFFTFRSLLVALLLVATVMTGVFVDVSVSAIGGGSLLYLAYLIVQSILMGAAIDYGILFANYYREKRTTLDIGASLKEAYRGTIHTILTSGLILILVPGAMAVLVDDPTVSSIVQAISIGALATVILVLLVLPGMLAACDRIERKRK